ncbi:hypothetical protein Gotur_035254 [Gossypium turneri]
MIYSGVCGRSALKGLEL